MRGMMLRWFDHHIRGKDTEPFAQRVRFFMRGSNDWHDAAEWPPENAILRPFYLLPEGGLCETPAVQDQKMLYTADPYNPTPSTICDHAAAHFWLIGHKLVSGLMYYASAAQFSTNRYASPVQYMSLCLPKPTCLTQILSVGSWILTRRAMKQSFALE